MTFQEIHTTAIDLGARPPIQAIMECPSVFQCWLDRAAWLVSLYQAGAAEVSLKKAIDECNRYAG